MARCLLCFLWFLKSREDQATTLGFWNPVPELVRRVDPQTNGILCAGESCLLGGTVRGAPRQLGHLGNDCFVLVAPVDDEFVLILSASPNLYFKISARTCFTGYGFALPPSRCKLILSSTPALRNR